MTNTEKLKQLVEELGGRVRVAERLDVSHVAVHYWIHGQSELPLKRAMQLCKMPNYSVSVKELLTDLDI